MNDCGLVYCRKKNEGIAGMNNVTILIRPSQLQVLQQIRNDHSRKELKLSAKVSNTKIRADPSHGLSPRPRRPSLSPAHFRLLVQYASHMCKLSTEIRGGSSTETKPARQKSRVQQHVPRLQSHLGNRNDSTVKAEEILRGACSSHARRGRPAP